MSPYRLLVLAALVSAACTNRPAENPYLDGGLGLRAYGESCARDAQCVAPYRCVAFTCGTPPDAAVALDASAVDAASAPDAAQPASSSSSVGAPSSVAGGSSSVAGSSSAAASSVGASSAAGSSLGALSSSAGASSSASGPGGVLGADCAQDGECASGLCREVYAASTVKVCVAPCTGAADCGVDGRFFCDALTVGGTTGYCVPHSPAHCAGCSADADCGRFSETCVTPPGEDRALCQVDCALGGAAACPSDYTCQALMVAGVQRHLCRPTTGACAAALGGFCDRISADQPCAAASDAGVCSGTRTCGAGARFSACSAAGPDCLPTCSTPQPAGCTVTPCPGAANTATDCGTCGTPCPGSEYATTRITCAGATTCTFACAGENYDVDGLPSTGCEQADVPTGNHDQAAAVDLGSFSCHDGSSAQDVSGRVPADGREHVPAITGFSAVTGSAPDWLKLTATGGLTCVNDFSFTLQVTGSATPDCFRLAVTTDNGSWSCTTNLSGLCTVAQGSGSYSGDTTILFDLTKTCGTTASPELATYRITGHL